MAAHKKLRKSAAGIAAVFAAAFLIQLFGMTRAISIYDESLELFAAVRIMHGDLPYRDFWTMYGPAQFYVLAGLFKLFGTSVFVARLYHCFAGACVTATLFMVLSKLCSRTLALCASLAATIWMTGVQGLAYEAPIYPALALTLCSVLLLCPLFEDRQKPMPIFLSGLSVGCVTLFRHDFGFYVFLAELPMIAWLGAATQNSIFRRFAALNLKSVGIYALGTAVILVPTAVLLLSHMSFHDLYFDLVFVPARIYPKVRSLPFPALSTMIHPVRDHEWTEVEGAMDYFPVLAGLASLFYLISTRSAAANQGSALPARRLHILFTALLLLMTLKGMVRVSPTQLIQAIILAIGALAILLQRVARRRIVSISLVVICLLGSLFPSIVVTGMVLRRAVANSRNLFTHSADFYGGSPGGLFEDACRVPAGLDRMRCFYLLPPEVKAIDYIQAHTSPSETIYVGTTRHDKLAMNDLAFYFVSKRQSGTKWHDLHPGIETTAPIQKEMIANLVQSRTKYVVLETLWDHYEENNQSNVSSGVGLLDTFIRCNYVSVATFDHITILRLKSDLAASAIERPQRESHVCAPACVELKCRKLHP